MSSAPSISGITKFARPANIGMMNRKIISAACTEIRPLYWSPLKNCSPGLASSVRNASAQSPPIRKKTNVVTTYWTPITLWSVLTLK